MVKKMHWLIGLQICHKLNKDILVKQLKELNRQINYNFGLDSQLHADHSTNSN
jgi:hypothetical protein